MKLDKFFNHFWIIITICCFILIGISLVAEGSQQHITLGWDANTEPDLAGYIIYFSYDQGGPYELIGTNASDDTEFTWYEMFPGNNYYFVVTAFNDEEHESGYSNEVCAFIDYDKDYAIECGTEYPPDDVVPPDDIEYPDTEYPSDDTEYSSDKSGGGSSGGCFISVISPCS